MTPNQIIQLRTLLKKAKEVGDSGTLFRDSRTVSAGLDEIYEFIDKALALLPCPTCNGTKKINATSDMDLSTQWAVKRFPEPCPDCQQHSS